MKRTYAYGAAISQGLWPVQEDGYYLDPTAGLFAVADGFGGRGQGDLAAKLALESCRAPKSPPPAREGSGLSPLQLWQEGLLREVHQKLRRWNGARPAAGHGGCSLVLAGIEREREFVVTASGACAAVLYRAGRFQAVLLPQAAPRGAPGEPLFPLHALGLGAGEARVETRIVRGEPGDILFLFSSGVAWEEAAFQENLAAPLAFRAPGAELSSVAGLAAGGELGEAPWNQAVLAVEAPGI